MYGSFNFMYGSFYSCDNVLLKDLWETIPWFAICTSMVQNMKGTCKANDGRFEIGS